MQENDIRFQSGDLQLAGTLALPGSGEPYPGVLLITGSGQVDRNENHPKIRLNAFYDISHFLAENGIASLRFDKRGVGQSQGDYWSCGFEEHARDALAALQYMRRQETVLPKSIFILGHSEGAILATKLAGEGTDLAGIILLAGSAQTGEAVLKWQALQVTRGMKGINGFLIKTLHIDVAKAQQKQLDKIKKSSKDWVRQQLVAKINARWLREFMAYDPAVDFPRIRVPVLAITGSKDIQVDPADLERMTSLVKAPFEQHLIQGMTHILRVTESEAGVSDYAEEVKKPIEPQVLEIILQWLGNRIGGKDSSEII